MPTENRSSNTEQIKPLPCPLCGCSEIKVLGYADSDGTFVQCAECSVSVDVLSDMKPWNDRAQPTSDGYSAGGMADQGAGAFAVRDPEVEQMRAEVERLKGLLPEWPPRPPDGQGLPRYGLRWNGPQQPLAVPMDDGYWTPWHLAASAEPSGPAERGPWQPIAAPGQIQEGDWLSFTVAGSFICVQARLIINPGTAREEIIYNKQKNHYFVTSMAIDGTSTHKGVLVAKAKA